MEDPPMRQQQHPGVNRIISHNSDLLMGDGQIQSSGFTENRQPIRPESGHCSGEGMGHSSLDGGRDSTDILDEEARYQKELTDRIKRSYVDLGMKPEGILLRGDDKDNGEILKDSLEIDDSLDYGVLKNSHPSNGDVLPEESRELAPQEPPDIESSGENSSPKVEGSVEQSEELLKNVIDEQLNTSGRLGRTQRLNEGVMHILPPENNRNSSEGQRETNVEVQSDFVKDPHLVTSEDCELDNSTERTSGDPLRDSLEDYPQEHEEGYLKDSLEIGNTVNDTKEGDLSSSKVVDNVHGEDEVKPHRTMSAERELSRKSSGDNTNNNAQSAESPPSGRQYGGFNDDYNRQTSDPPEEDGEGNYDTVEGNYQYENGRGHEYSNHYVYKVDGEYGLGQAIEEQYGDENTSSRCNFNQDHNLADEYQFDVYQQSSEACTHDQGQPRSPLVPPPMPPEPPPPLLMGKPPSAGKISRPTTNQFNVDEYQEDLAAQQQPDRHSTQQVGNPSAPQPPLNYSKMDSLPQATHHERNPHAKREGRFDSDPTIGSLPMSVGHQRPLNTNEELTSEMTRLPLHTKPQAVSYLDQFRGKQVLLERDGYPLTSPNGAGHGPNPKPIPTSSAGSDASLESLRFQALPREDSITRTNRQKEQTSEDVLLSAKKPQVAYISDDSDDEEMHFVDELGNPLDAHGNILTDSAPLEKEVSKLEYRMKRVPSKKDSPAKQYQSSPSHRGAVSMTKVSTASPANKKISRNSQIPSVSKATSSRAGSKVSRMSQVPSAVSTGRRSTRHKPGMELDKSPLVSEITQTDLPVEEELLSSKVDQVEGGLEGSLPSHKPKHTVTDTSTGGQIPSQTQVPQYMNAVNHHYVNPPGGFQQLPNQFVTGQTIPEQVVLTNQPAFISPSTSYAFAPQVYAQLQPALAVGMSPVQTVLQPVLQHPQVFVGGAQQMPPQFVQMQGHQPTAQNFSLAYHQPLQQQGYGGGEGQLSGHRGEDTGRLEGTEESPLPDVSSSESGTGKHHKHPNGVRELLAERNSQFQGKKRTPKTGKNFIDANKNNVKNLPPEKKYRDLHTNVKSVKSTMNHREPLPNISREFESDGSERWAYREGVTGAEDEGWAKQLVEEQRMLAVLKRHQSESDILDLHEDARGVRGQGMLQSQSQKGYGSSNERHSPRALPGQVYSYSADRAVSYARMRGPVGSDQRSDKQHDRDRFAYTHPMPARCSPFEVLPDIQKDDIKTRTSDPDGYLVKLQKQRHQRPSYKEYTMKDYRALKRDIKLGGLGPDPDQIQEKQEKAQRQKEYARAIMEQNKKTLKKTSKPWTPPREEPLGQENSKRGAALRYAKNIPRPPLRTNQEELHGQLYGRGSQQSNTSQREGAKTYMMEELANLEELAERHRQEKEEIERLRNGHTP